MEASESRLKILLLLAYKNRNLMYTTKQGSRVTSSNVLLGRGSEKAFNECPGVSNVLPSAALAQVWLLILTYVNPKPGVLAPISVPNLTR